MRNNDHIHSDEADIENNYGELFGDWWEESRGEAKETSENGIDEKYLNGCRPENGDYRKYDILNEDKMEMCGDGDAYTKHCSVYSLHDQLFRSPLQTGTITIQTRMDKLFTRTLTIFTIISICFLFWLQNSPYNIEGHNQPKRK